MHYVYARLELRRRRLSVGRARDVGWKWKAPLRGRMCTRAYHLSSWLVCINKSQTSHADTHNYSNLKPVLQFLTINSISVRGKFYNENFLVLNAKMYASIYACYIINKSRYCRTAFWMRESKCAHYYGSRSFNNWSSLNLWTCNNALYNIHSIVFYAIIILFICLKWSRFPWSLW